MPGPGSIDVPDGSKGRLNATRHLLQKDVEAGHLLLMDDDAASREEGVPVAVYEHALHDRLGQVAGPGACAAHLPRGTPPCWLLGGGASAAQLPHRTHPAGSPPETNAKQTSPRLKKKKKSGATAVRQACTPRRPCRLRDSRSTSRYFTIVCTANQRSPCAQHTCFARYGQSPGVATSGQEHARALRPRAEGAPEGEVGTRAHTHTRIRKMLQLQLSHHIRVTFPKRLSFLALPPHPLISCLLPK